MVCRFLVVNQVVSGCGHLDDGSPFLIQVSAGQGQVTVLQEGYFPVTVPIDVVAGQKRVVRIERRYDASSRSSNSTGGSRNLADRSSAYRLAP